MTPLIWKSLACILAVWLTLCVLGAYAFSRLLRSIHAAEPKPHQPIHMDDEQ